MPYGILKVDTVTFTSNGVDKSVSISGLVQNPTFSGNITSTGTISGVTIQGGTLVSGATVTGSNGQFTTITGGTAGFATVTGTTVTGTTANFVTLSGTTVTGVTSNFQSGVFTARISGLAITGNTAGFTTVTGTTVTGTTANFVTVSGTSVTGDTGGFTTVTGTTVTGTTANFISGVFTTRISGATITGATGNFGTLNASSIPGYAVLSGAQTFSGGQRGLVNIISYATGIALDLSTSNNFQITLSGNTTLQNPTNITSGQAGIVSIIQSTGSNTMAFGSYWQYPGGSGSVPSLTSTSGSTDVLAYYVVNTTKIAYRLVQDIKA